MSFFGSMNFCEFIIFRSVTVKMMWIADVSYNLFILGRNLILSTAKEHVTIVPRPKALLRRMSPRLQSIWLGIIPFSCFFFLFSQLIFFLAKLQNMLYSYVHLCAWRFSPDFASFYIMLRLK